MNRLYVNEHEFIELPDASLSVEIARRSRSYDFAGLATWLPNPDPVLRKTGKTIAVYRELVTDSDVAGAIESRQSAALCFKWRINREGVDSTSGEAVERLFERLNVNRIMAEMLNALPYGYQPMEVIWEVHDGWAVPHDIIAKPPEWFIYDPENQLRFLSRDSSGLGELLPPRKFLVARHNPSYANPYGEAILSRCFWPITFKRGGLRFWVTFVERYGMPWVVAKYPTGYTQEQANQYLRDVDAMVQDAVLVLPEGLDASVVPNANAGNVELFERLLRWCSSEVSKGWLGHDGATQSTPGRLGNEEGAINVRSDIVSSDRRSLEEWFNEIIGWIYELNWSSAAVRARFELYTEEEIDLALANRDKALTEQGVRFKKSYYAAAYSLQEEDFDVVDLDQAKAAQAPPHLPAAGTPIASPALKEGVHDRTSSSPPGQQEEPDAPGGFAERDSCCTTAHAEADTVHDPGQQMIDELLSRISPEQLQYQMQQALEPVIALVTTSTDYTEAMARLVDLYPAINTQDLQAVLERALFIAETIGRLGVDAEETQGR